MVVLRELKLCTFSSCKLGLLITLADVLIANPSGHHTVVLVASPPLNQGLKGSHHCNYNAILAIMLSSFSALSLDYRFVEVDIS